MIGVLAKSARNQLLRPLKGAEEKRRMGDLFPQA
jgi:hypothetical protein